MSAQGGTKRDLLLTIHSLQKEVVRLSGLRTEAIDLLRDLSAIFEEYENKNLAEYDQDTTQYAVWEFLRQQPGDITKENRNGK